MPDLLNCPFCGAAIDDMGDADSDGYFGKCSDGTLSVCCSICRTIGPSEMGRVAAISAWNTRADAPELLALVAAAKDAREIAMKGYLAARVPECGWFAQIAQDLDAALSAYEALK